jgi:multicomponent Na+:H+ antiporter subunit F
LEAFATGAALFLALTLAAGLIRIYIGPQPADRMQALLLFGTTTVAILLLLAYGHGPAAMLDVALVFVMLAAIGTVAFVCLPASLAASSDDGPERASPPEERRP